MAIHLEADTAGDAGELGALLRLLTASSLCDSRRWHK
jgi:hypothetical protein